MQTPMIGTWTATVKGIRPFTIHSDLYYELVLSREGEEGQVAVRVPQHACEPIGTGDRVELSFLMGQVTQVKKILP